LAAKNQLNQALTALLLKYLQNANDVLNEPLIESYESGGLAEVANMLWLWHGKK
jgi:hypothetical protein